MSSNLEAVVLRMQRLNYIRQWCTVRQPTPQPKAFDMSDAQLDKAIAKAQKALDQMLLDQGDDPKEQPYVVTPDEGGQLYAVPRDAEAASECHLEWHPKEGWLMVERPAPKSGEEPWRNWWARVRRHAERGGVLKQGEAVVVPSGALTAWRAGLSCVWYAHHKLEPDLGRKTRVMPPLCSCYGEDCEKCT